MIWLRTVLSRCVITGLFLDIALFSKDTLSSSLEPVVTAKAGSFQGLQVSHSALERIVYAFIGIPYAEPPTGPKRFSKPTPIDSIPGIYNATTKPPSCFQLQSSLHAPWADRNSSMSEDCLYLNIWTPERISTDETLKPVMVWIHGGGFMSGSSAMDLYDGQVLSALGNVLVVTFNYRLGPFGFLYSLTDEIPGNVGLYDQLLVLKWVQNNIEYFGGDPKRVTLFGESAGAKCSSLLALSPLSRGLFHRVIIQSGAPYVLPGPSPTSIVQNGNLLATLVGCANDTFTFFTNLKDVASCMRSVPAAELVKTYYRVNCSDFEPITILFMPTFCDELIPTHPIDTFLTKNYSTYDMFSGVTQVEGSSLFAYFFHDIYQQYVEKSLVITKTLAAAMLDGLLKTYGIAHPQQIIEYYLNDIGEDVQSILIAMGDTIGDFLIACPTVYFAERYSEKGTPVFFYRFDHRPSTSHWHETMGATHFDEVQFVFGLPMRYPDRYQDEEKALSEYMIRTWTNFAKSEGLTLKTGSPWPNYSRSKPDFATFQTGQQATGSGIRKKACEFWRPYFHA